MTAWAGKEMHSTLFPQKESARESSLQGVKICIFMYLYISKAPGEVFLTFREGANSAVTFLLYLFLVTTHPFPKGLFCCMSHIFPTLSLAAIYDKSYPQQRIQEGIVSFSEGTMMLRGYSAVCVLRYPPEGDIA